MHMCVGDIIYFSRKKETLYLNISSPLWGFICVISFSIFFYLQDIIIYKISVISLLKHKIIF